MSLRDRTLGLVDRHPVRVVGAAGLAVAVTHLAWVVAFRPLGTFNPDESGYLVDAFQYQRALTDGLLGGGRPTLAPVLERIGDTTTGPLVPLLSVPFVLIGSRSVASALVVPILLYVVAAVAVTAIVRQLGTSRRAVVAGLVVLGLPGPIVAARSYVFATAVAAGLSVAVLLLLRSERGQRLWAMVGFGAVVGLMVLARPMAAAFVPGLVVAAIIVVERNRIVARNVVVAVVVAAALVAPWWLAAGSRVARYLVDYGYSDLVEPYGSEGMVGRVVERFGVAALDVRPLLLIPALVLVGMALLEQRRRSRAVRAAGGSRTEVLRTIVADHRDAVAVVAVVVVGYGALLTTANSGVLFELPLEVLSVVIVAALAPLVAPGPRRTLGTVLLVGAGLNLLLVGNVSLGESVQFRSGDQTLSAAGFAFGDHYQPPTALRTRDPLLLSDPTDRRAVGGAWWRANQQVAAGVDRLRSSDGLVHQTVTGSRSLINANTLELAQELQERPATATDTVDAGRADLSGSLTPTVGRSPRVLVVLDSAEDPFPIDRGWRRVLAAARAAGWRQAAAVDLPDGGRALLLVAPAAGGGS